MTQVYQSGVGSPITVTAANRFFSEPVTDLEAVVPNTVFRALFTHRQHRIDAVYTEPVDGPVTAIVLLTFGVQLVTPAITEIIVKM